MITKTPGKDNMSDDGITIQYLRISGGTAVILSGTEQTNGDFRAVSTAIYQGGDPQRTSARRHTIPLSLADSLAISGDTPAEYAKLQALRFLEFEACIDETSRGAPFPIERLSAPTRSPQLVLVLADLAKEAKAVFRILQKCPLTSQIRQEIEAAEHLARDLHTQDFGEGLRH